MKKLSFDQVNSSENSGDSNARYRARITDEQQEIIDELSALKESFEKDGNAETQEDLKKNASHTKEKNNAHTAQDESAIDIEAEGFTIHVKESKWKKIIDQLKNIFGFITNEEKLLKQLQINNELISSMLSSSDEKKLLFELKVIKILKEIANAPRMQEIQINRIFDIQKNLIADLRSMKQNKPQLQSQLHVNKINDKRSAIVHTTSTISHKEKPNIRINTVPENRQSKSIASQKINAQHEIQSQKENPLLRMQYPQTEITPYTMMKPSYNILSPIQDIMSSIINRVRDYLLEGISGLNQCITPYTRKEQKNPSKYVCTFSDNRAYNVNITVNIITGSAHISCDKYPKSDIREPRAEPAGYQLYNFR